MEPSPEIYLIDNGSLRPQATFALRSLAADLSERAGVRVQAVSLLHSHKIAAEDLGGVPATIVKRRMRAALAEGCRQFVFLPLFLGPSRAITDYLPEVIEELRQESGEFETVVAQTLCGESALEPDVRLAQLLADHVRQQIESTGTQRPMVTLVDHGTPAKIVNTLRNSVAGQLAELLGDEVAGVVASSMERREGPEYEFNEPLLERLDQLESGSATELIVAMFFLLPGRHAGEGGDVAEICDGLRERSSYNSIYTTSLLGEHSGLVEILADRLSGAINELAGQA